MSEFVRFFYSPPASGTDYIYVNSSVYKNGTSFVESLFETFGELKFQHVAVRCITGTGVLGDVVQSCECKYVMFPSQTASLET